MPEMSLQQAKGGFEPQAAMPAGPTAHVGASSPVAPGTLLQGAAAGFAPQAQRVDDVAPVRLSLYTSLSLDLVAKRIRSDPLASGVHMYPLQNSIGVSGIEMTVRLSDIPAMLTSLEGMGTLSPGQKIASLDAAHDQPGNVDLVLLVFPK